jgi:glyoxylase-like metal-dependent hydrolase (beta-lactamase superfamily II)
MAVRRFSYEFDGVSYYRFSIYRLGNNIQTVYAFILDDLLIDTAQRYNRDNILQVATDKSVRNILLTHHHEDHSGNIAYLMKSLNAKAYAHPLAVSILRDGYKMSPLGKLINGEVERADLIPLKEYEVFTTANYSLQSIYTPGHTEDHYCYYEKNKGWLFSGDLYVADKIKYFSINECLFTQIASLKKLLQLDFDVLFCAHNPKVEGGKQRLRNKLNFFEDFSGQALKYYKEGYSTRQIFDLMGMKEHHFNKAITLGNFSAENMLLSVLNKLK